MDKKKKISPKELNELLNKKDSKVICVDLRTEEEHDFAHIPGTVNIPLDRLQNHLSELKGYDKVILQCTTGARSQFACNVLPENVKCKALSLEGGITQWEKDGFKVKYKGKARIPIMRQVFLFTGSFIITGLFLNNATGNDWFLMFPLIVGLGLLFAGITGQCMLSKILIKMPWNKH